MSVPDGASVQPPTTDMADLERRLIALAGASRTLLQSLHTDDVVGATMAVAREVLVADGYALWRTDAGNAGWRKVKADGVSDAFANRIVTSVQGRPASAIELSGPLVAPDVRSQPLLEEQADAYDREGIRSMLVFPLSLHGRFCATLVFYFRSPHDFDDVEVRTGEALANLAAAAITTAELYEDQRRNREAAEYSARQAAFLAEAGQVLSASLDYHKTLATVAELAVPHIADWCAVHALDDAGSLQQVAIAHANPAKLDLAARVQREYPGDPSSTYGVMQAIRTGQAVVMTDIPDAFLVAAARDAAHLSMLRQLALTSYLIVPMISRGESLGTITFVAGESGRHYTAADVQFAESVASRAALAVDNARAYSRANEANRLKDEFLATLSHELRTPLNAVLGYARLLRSSAFPPDRQARALEVLQRNANSLKQIIEDVLDVSRIVAGKLRLNVQPVDLRTILEDAVGTVAPAAEAKSIRVETSVAANTGLVSGDPDRLRQAVWNLLSNAVKFTPKGGSIRVAIERLPSSVDIVVSDTGQGIAPEFLPHVFERFRQADSRFSREHGGLGLGLAIVRQIVELHGGTVHAASDGPGAGATFRMTLPDAAARPDLPPVPARVQIPEDIVSDPITLRRLDGLRVVAVDDDEDALLLVRSILESAGADVVTASSASAALDLLGEAAPDVLIADVGMPLVDGFAFIRSVRQLPGALSRVPAAALTAYARDEDRLAALSSGFDMHIAKPVDAVALVAALASLTKR